MLSLFGYDPNRLDRLAESSHRRSMERLEKMRGIYRDSANACKCKELEARIEKLEQHTGLRADSLTQKASDDV